MTLVPAVVGAAALSYVGASQVPIASDAAALLTVSAAGDADETVTAEKVLGVAEARPPAANLADAATGNAVSRRLTAQAVIANPIIETREPIRTRAAGFAVTAAGRADCLPGAVGDAEEPLVAEGI